jgi:hypothetical protein
MKLISFDVGLRNLAFCILEGTSRKDVKILGWDLIDVMAEGSSQGIQKCFKCKKTAIWSSSTNLFACTTHKPKLPTKSLLGKKSLEYLKKESDQEFKTKKEYIDFIYKKNPIWKRCVKSCKAGSVVDLAPLIASALTARTSMWTGANKVIFEQQPDKRMLAVQGMMHMWFVCHGYDVKGVSAVHKLTNIVTLEDSTKTYKGRKKTGIVHASELVPSNDLKTFLLKHPKKDDLADCFLQGLWYMENGK